MARTDPCHAALLARLRVSPSRKVGGAKSSISAELRVYRTRASRRAVSDRLTRPPRLAVKVPKPSSSVPVDYFIERLQADRLPLPAILQTMQKQGIKSFYREEQGDPQYVTPEGKFRPLITPPGRESCKVISS